MGRWICESELDLGVWVGDINLEVVSHGRGYYALVKGDRERRAQDQAWGLQHEEGREPAKRKRRGSQREKESQRRAASAEPRQQIAFGGKWCSGGWQQATCRMQLRDQGGPGQKGRPRCGHTETTHDSNQRSFAGVGAEGESGWSKPVVRVEMACEDNSLRSLVMMGNKETHPQRMRSRVGYFWMRNTRMCWKLSK